MRKDLCRSFAQSFHKLDLPVYECKTSLRIFLKLSITYLQNGQTEFFFGYLDKKCLLKVAHVLLMNILYAFFFLIIFHQKFYYFKHKF